MIEKQDWNVINIRRLSVFQAETKTKVKERHKPGVLGRIRVLKRRSLGKSFSASFHEAAEIQPRHYCFIEGCGPRGSQRRFGWRLFTGLLQPLFPFFRLPPLLQLVDPLARPQPRLCLLAAPFRRRCRRQKDWIVAEVQIVAKVSEPVVWNQRSEIAVEDRARRKRMDNSAEWS